MLYSLTLVALLQACHVPIKMAEKTNAPFANLIQTKSVVELPSGTPIVLAVTESPNIKDIYAQKSIAFEVQEDVFIEEQKVVAATAKAWGKIVHIQSGGSNAPDVVTIQLESTKAVNWQTVSFKAEGIKVYLNLHDLEKPVLKRGFKVTGYVANTVTLEL